MDNFSIIRFGVFLIEFKKVTFEFVFKAFYLNSKFSKIKIFFIKIVLKILFNRECFYRNLEIYLSLFGIIKQEI